MRPGARASLYVERSAGRADVIGQLFAFALGAGGEVDRAIIIDRLPLAVRSLAPAYRLATVSA